MRRPLAVRGPAGRAATAFPVALALLGLLLSPDPARPEGDGDKGAAPPDTTGVERVLVSTDGAVTVYEEAAPGEGIEGFWWEYDAEADLLRLLDKDLRQELLEPLVDQFGFEVAVPESIRALRDSVTAVADSILAERIEVEAVFDPKFTSSYNETKDRFVLTNRFETSYPLSRLVTATTQLTSSNEFNESTGKIKDDRRISSTFNFKFRENLVSSLSVDRSDALQERNAVRDSESENTTVTGTIRDTRSLLWFDVETTLGLSANRRNYQTQVTDGRNEQFSPNWRLKLSRDYDRGAASLDYSGNRATSRREEVRTVAGVDSLGQQIQTQVQSESDDANFDNKVDVSATYRVNPDTDLRFTGTFSRDQFQYLSQADSLQGRQETRTREGQSTRLVLNAKPLARLEVRANLEYRLNATDFALENVKSTTTTTRQASTDLTYEAWKGSRWIFKMESSDERRDYNTAQAGDVLKQKGSIDFKQEVTENVDFEAAFFVALDRFEFDDTAANTGDRDLRTRRGTFTVRYNPFTSLTSSVKMELRQTESINIHPLKSGDNSTDYIFLINPTYTWKIGKASFTGDFSADARYKVQDFKDEDNTLTRRFFTRQKWQHGFNDRLSTEVQFRYEFSDQGSYNRSPIDGRRRYARSSETRRTTIETKIRYTVVPGLLADVLYRRDSDDQFAVSQGERTLINELPTRQFTYGLTYKRKLMNHVSLDVKFSQTLKDGLRISDVEKNFYTIRAQLVYQPLKKGSKKKPKRE